jgi:hypothetical protein
MADKISPKDKDRILKEAASRLGSYAKEGLGVDKYSVNLKYWFEQQPEVSKAEIRGRTTITVEFSDNTAVGFLLDREKLYGCGDNYDESPDVGGYPAWSRLAKPLVTLRDMIELIQGDRVPISLSSPGTKKALLFDPLYDDWPPEATTDSIETSLTNAGYSVDKLLGDDGDLQHLETIENNRYGVIFIRSHGGVLAVGGDDKIHIMARPFFDSYPDPADSGYTGIGVFFLSTNWGDKYAYAFNDGFVRHHLAATRFPNTLMHLLVCHGGDPLGRNDMIDAFLDFGVGCYTGWTRNASLQHGDPAAVEFFNFLCGGVNRTASQAVNRIISLGHSPDPTTGADLVGYGACNSITLMRPPRIELEFDKEHIETLRRFPGEPIEIVIGPGRIPDIWPVGGKLLAEDGLGRRRLVLGGENFPPLSGGRRGMEGAIDSLKSK